MHSRKLYTKLFAIFFTGLAIRVLVGLQGIHGTDILAHVEGARSFLLTGSPYCLANYSYPPLYSAIQSIGIIIFGWNVIGYKFASILFDSLLTIAIFFVVRRFTGDENLAIASSLLWALNPLAIVASAWYGLFDSIPALLSMLSIYTLSNLGAALSALLLSLAIVAKTYPLIYLPPNIAFLKSVDIKKALGYFAIVAVVSLCIEYMLSFKCFERSLQNQFLFHIERLDKGLSLMPRIQYMSIASMVISMVAGLFIQRFLADKGTSKDMALAISAAFSTVLLVMLNPFIYPHYVIWFSPMVLAVFMILYKHRGIWISALYTLVLSAIGLLYWRFYRDTFIVLTDSIALYATILSMLMMTKRFW
ncbi:MAG: hypothetical protein QXT53_06060 [Ignisphaera sp.]